MHGKSTFQIGNVKDLFSLKDSSDRIRETTIIPPQSGKFINATISRVTQSDCDVFIEGYIDEVLVPRSLVKATRKVARVLAINPSDKSVRLLADMVLSKVNNRC